MENLTILLLVITFTCYNASKTDWNANALEFLPNEKRKLKFLQNQQKISHSGKCSAGAKLSSDILGIIASGLSPKESFKMSRTSRSWSKAHKLVYVNLTPTDNPVAIFKKYDEEMFFLEDPNKLLEIGLPQLNYMIPIQYYWTNESNMWMFLFGYAMMGFWKHQNHWAKMRSPPVTKYFTMVPRNFMKSIGKVTAKYCPLDMRLVPPFLPTLHDHDPHCLHLRVYTPLLLAAENNDVEVMRILLKRTEGLLNVPREESFIFLSKITSEASRILLNHVLRTRDFTHIQIDDLEYCELILRQLGPTLYHPRRPTLIANRQIMNEPQDLFQTACSNLSKKKHWLKTGNYSL